MRGGGARRPRHHRLGRRTVKVWRDGACERTIQAHSRDVWAVAVLPGGARFVSGSRHTAKLWTLDGDLDRTFEVGSTVFCVAALPDGVHFVVGLGVRGIAPRRRPLYHVDGTLVHTFKGHTDDGERGGGDARRPAHHQRLG